MLMSPIMINTFQMSKVTNKQKKTVLVLSYSLLSGWVCFYSKRVPLA